MFRFKREKGGHGEYMVTAVFFETLAVWGGGKGLKHTFIHLAVPGGDFVAALRSSHCGAPAPEQVCLAAPSKWGSPFLLTRG